MRTLFKPPIVPFHWGDLFGEGNAANYLTISAIGRVAKQPELKFWAVALEKAPVRPAQERAGSISDGTLALAYASGAPLSRQA